MQRETPADNIRSECCTFFVSSGLRYDCAWPLQPHTFHLPPRARRGHRHRRHPKIKTNRTALARPCRQRARYSDNPALDLDHALAPYRGADDFELLHVISKAAQTACHHRGFTVGRRNWSASRCRNGSANSAPSAFGQLSEEALQLSTTDGRVAACAEPRAHAKNQRLIRRRRPARTPVRRFGIIGTGLLPHKMMVISQFTKEITKGSTARRGSNHQGRNTQKVLAALDAVLLDNVAADAVQTSWLAIQPADQRNHRRAHAISRDKLSGKHCR